MAISLRDILAFFVEFERALILEAPPGVFEEEPRSSTRLLERFSAYFGGPIRVVIVESYEGLDLAGDVIIRNDELGSLVLVYYKDKRPVGADILLNNAKLTDDKPVFNYCYRRFLAIKEAFHVVLRFELIKEGRNYDYPDSNQAKSMMPSIERLIFLPFAIIDFDDPEYTDDVKIENAAELLAVLMLYPIEKIASDRNTFTAAVGAEFDDPTAIATSTKAFAELHKIPQRYVDLIFRWQGFDSFYSRIRQLRAGH